MFSLLELFTLPVLLGLLSCGGADIVTWPECKALGRSGRTLGPGRDDNATILGLFLCHIQQIHPGAFDGLPNLSSISLSTNDITHLDPTVFNSVPNLQILGLEFNEMREIPVFEHPLPFMTHLLLHGNRIAAISSIKTFSGCKNLQHLDLHSNAIEYIHPDVFKPLTGLTKLYLHNNKLRFISDGIFQLKSLEYLYLQQNSIEFVSPLAFHGSRLKNLFLNHNKITHLQSNFISDLVSAGAELSQFYFHKNPWFCDSLLEVLGEVKKAGVRGYHSGYYDGTRPVCHFTSIVPAKSLKLDL